MNAVDYFFENSKNSNKLFIANKREATTHKELYEDTCKVATFLNNNYGTNNSILLYATNSRFFIVTYLAIIKSGNICTPINPGASKSTIHYIVEETKPQIAFVQKRFKENLVEKSVNIVGDEEFGDILSQNPFTGINIDNNFDPEAIAEIIYTSGSTSFPKGVIITHKNLVANTTSIVEYLKLKENDRVLIVLPFYYCYGLSLLHTHLRVGGSIVLNNSFMFLGSVINDLKNYQCTGFSGVPSHFQILLRKSDSFKNTKFEHLRYVTQAGGKLHKVFIEEFINNFPDILFYVMYGQTEATARLSYLPPERLKEKLGSIGFGIPGVELKVIDSEGNETKNGEIGEIAAKGDNIMKGYFNAPELTEKTLVNGYLITGDLAKKDDDGYIYLVARKKEIIKVGGERISPKEIEEVIVSVPKVIDVTIEGIYDEILGEKLKATIVVNDSTDKEELKESILAACKNKLSPIKTPQVIVFENKVNVNSSGKKVKA